MFLRTTNSAHVPSPRADAVDTTRGRNSECDDAWSRGTAVALAFLIFSTFTHVSC